MVIDPPDGAYRSPTLQEKTAATELQVLRDWAGGRAEVTRLEVMLELEHDEFPDKDQTYLRMTEDRLTNARREVTRWLTWLESAGWDLR